VQGTSAALLYRYLPAGQAMQPALLEFSTTWLWTVPVLLVVWPAGQARQEVEPEADWYLEAGQATQASKNAAVTVMSLCATQAFSSIRAFLSQAAQVAVIKSGVAAVSAALNQRLREV
jgi:hypothetical protein